MAFILTSDQEVPISVAFADDHGNPATVDGIPVWASSDETILSVVASADGMSAVAAAVGPDGLATLTLTADADLGAGIISDVATLDFQIVSGQAFSAMLTPGDPRPTTVVAPVTP